MFTLETLTSGQSLVGIEPAQVVPIVAAVPVGNGAVQAIYKTADGVLKERLLTRADEPNISIATVERPWSFDGDGANFKLAVEAKRIDLGRVPERRLRSGQARRLREHHHRELQEQDMGMTREVGDG